MSVHMTTEQIKERSFSQIHSVIDTIFPGIEVTYADQCMWYEDRSVCIKMITCDIHEGCFEVYLGGDLIDEMWGVKPAANEASKAIFKIRKENAVAKI